MISTWFTGKNYYNMAVEKDRDIIFTTILKPGFTDMLGLLRILKKT